jgi:hypothetical protein
LSVRVLKKAVAKRGREGQILVSDIQRDRETESQRDRETERQRERKRERDKEREREIERDS